MPSREQVRRKRRVDAVRRPVEAAVRPADEDNAAAVAFAFMIEAGDIAPLGLEAYRLRRRMASEGYSMRGMQQMNRSTPKPLFTN